MNILLITAYFPPEIGSASHLFHGLGRAFRRRGHRVGVVTGFPGYHPQGDLSRYQGRIRMTEDVDGLIVDRTRVLEIARDTPVGRGLWQFSCAATLAVAALHIPKPDVALVFSPPLPLGVTALVLRALRGVPCVVNVQDLFPQSAIDLGLMRSRQLIALFERLERAVYRRANAITVHSKGNLRHVLARGAEPSRASVMQNCVDTDQIRPGPRNNEMRRELHLDGRFVASFAGIMGHAQDLDVILEAARLVEGRSDIVFVLAGEGVAREGAMARCNELGLTNVVWLPMLPRDRYPLLLQASDLCLTTLKAAVRTPVVPSKILSALSAGRPVLAALDETGDSPELIAAAGAGYTVPPESPDRFANVLIEMSRRPELCRRLGDSGRAFAERHLSEDVVAAAYERIFEGIVRRPGSGARDAEPGHDG